SNFLLDLLPELRQRGTHPSFHTLLLRIHHANNDRRFPGRQISQLPAFTDSPHEWAVDQILSHSVAGKTALLEICWSTGDTSWAPYTNVAHLEHMAAYLELQNVDHISKL
ncbi:hypothetical protein FA95DRAFT_1462808, partial [Auriscalpium vulgare]